jgi:ATP-dependent Clp protease adaptor protein ClpS
MPVECEVEPATTTRLTPRYKVICHDDPKTTMDFVVLVLVQAFLKEPQEAVDLMFKVHEQGFAIVAVMPLEEAEFRVDKAHSMARTAGYPLTFTYEPE